MITTIALLLTAQDPAGFNPHMATCWTDPNCAAEYMGGRDGRRTQGQTDNDDSGEHAGTDPQQPAAARHGSGDMGARPLCSGDLSTDRRCLNTPRAELGEGINTSGTFYPAYDATEMHLQDVQDSPGALDCGPGDKGWPCGGPGTWFPLLRNVNWYRDTLDPAFREQLRSEILRPDEPAVQVIDDHTFLIRRDQLPFFHVLWRKCPACVEVRSGQERDAERVVPPDASRSEVRRLEPPGRGARANLQSSWPLGSHNEGSDTLILTYHRPHNWRQYAERQHISDLWPADGRIAENREIRAGLVLSPYDLRYEYARPVHGLSELREGQDMGGLEQSSGRDSVSLSPLQMLVRQRALCTQYCGDRPPLEMQYDLAVRTATTGTRPGVVEPVVASSLPAAQLLILEVAREHWQEVLDANAAADRWLGIPTIEPRREDWPDMGIYGHLIPADRRGEDD